MTPGRELSAYSHRTAPDAKRRRVVSAWDSGELGLTEIAREFHVGNERAWAWVEAAFAAGETKREPGRPARRGGK